MKKIRPEFACWQCERTFAQVVDLEGEPLLRVECPYCGAEGTVDMAPYRHRVVTVTRGEEADSGTLRYELAGTVPTTKPEANGPAREASP